ncbi:MAG: hypothetical protein Kow00107_02440 [Planctomycetota bacterium]
MTLIEILVVLSVLVILMAIILPSMSAYRSASLKAKTSALLNNLSLGLDAYKNDYRSYPNIPSSTDFYGELNKLLYTALSGDDNLNFSVDATDRKGYVEFPADALDRSTGTTAPFIVDAFDRRIGYWPYPLYHNRTSFNLWSKGPDDKTGEDAELGDDGVDDINNWK